MESGECLHTLLGHTAEIVSLNFDTNGQRVMTGSFDHTVKRKCEPDSDITIASCL